MKQKTETHENRSPKPVITPLEDRFYKEYSLKDTDSQKRILKTGKQNGAYVVFVDDCAVSRHIIPENAFDYIDELLKDYTTRLGWRLT